MKPFMYCATIEGGWNNTQVHADLGSVLAELATLAQRKPTSACAISLYPNGTMLDRGRLPSKMPLAMLWQGTAADAASMLALATEGGAK